jgi:hypothetical protein
MRSALITAGKWLSGCAAVAAAVTFLLLRVVPNDQLAVVGGVMSCAVLANLFLSSRGRKRRRSTHVAYSSPHQQRRTGEEEGSLINEMVRDGKTASRMDGGDDSSSQQQLEDDDDASGGGSSCARPTAAGPVPLQFAGEISPHEKKNQ